MDKRCKQVWHCAKMTGCACSSKRMRRMVSRTRPRRKSRHWSGFSSRTKTIGSPRPTKGISWVPFKSLFPFLTPEWTFTGLLHDGSAARRGRRPLPARGRPQDARHGVLVLAEETAPEVVLPAYSRRREGMPLAALLTLPCSSIAPLPKHQGKQGGPTGAAEEEGHEWQLCDVDEVKPVISVVQGDLALEELTIRDSEEELAAVREGFSAGSDVYVTLNFTVPEKEARILSHRCEWFATNKKSSKLCTMIT